MLTPSKSSEFLPYFTVLILGRVNKFVFIRLCFCTGTKHISYIKGTEIIGGFVYFSRNGLDAREGEGGNTGSI